MDCPRTLLLPKSSRQTVVAYDTTIPRGLNAYALLHFIAALVLALGS